MNPRTVHGDSTVTTTKTFALVALLMIVFASASGALSGAFVPDADKSLSGQRVGPDVHVFDYPGVGELLSCPLWAEEITCRPFQAAERCDVDFVSCVRSAFAAADGTAAAVASFAFRSCRACEDTAPGAARQGEADLALDVCEVSQCSFRVCEGGQVAKTLSFCRSDAELEACRSACAERVGRLPLSPF